MKSVLLPLVLANSLLFPEYVQCNLWKRVEIDGVKTCIYSSANNGIGYHYPTFSFRECPKQFQCKYSPNAKEKVTIKDILKGLSDGF